MVTLDRLNCCCVSSLSWLGKTLCPPDCLVKSNIKAPSCAAIFRLGIVVLQCVRTGEVFCGLHVAHVHIICPVRDVTHVRKCTRPSPALPYCKRREAGRGLGTRLRGRFVPGTSRCPAETQSPQQRQPFCPCVLSVSEYAPPSPSCHRNGQDTPSYLCVCGWVGVEVWVCGCGRGGG